MAEGGKGKRINRGEFGVFRTGADDTDNVLLGICVTYTVAANVLGLEEVSPMEFFKNLKLEDDDDITKLRPAPEEQKFLVEAFSAYVPGVRQAFGENFLTLKKIAGNNKYGLLLTPGSLVAVPKYSIAEMNEGQGVDANGKIEVVYKHVDVLTFGFPNKLINGQGQRIRWRDSVKTPKRKEGGDFETQTKRVFRGANDSLWSQYAARFIPTGENDNGEGKIPIIRGIVTKSGKRISLTKSIKLEGEAYKRGGQGFLQNRAMLPGGMPAYLTHPQEAYEYGINPEVVQFLNPAIQSNATLDGDSWSSVPSLAAAR